MPYYKAVRLDRTSHYDSKTLWRVGKTVRVKDPDPPDAGPCGRGIHCSPTILDAVSYQRGPSRYYDVEPDIITADETKSRCRAVQVIREIGRGEQDELAGFKLWEANHPVNPLMLRQKQVDLPVMVRTWASVSASVRASVSASVGASVGASVSASVGASVWASVWASVSASVWASVWDSVWAYVGGLFPGITTWKHAEKLGPAPWRPLLTMWYAGYVPSYDGTTWRVHAGPDARVVWEMASEQMGR